MKNETEKSKFFDRFLSEKTASQILIISGIVFIISIIVFICFGNWNFSKYLDEEKIGHFGNFIGGVLGTLLVLVSVIVYYLALREQRKDININQAALQLQISTLNQQMDEFKAQRKELEQTRLVYEEQTKIYKQQTQTMKIQQFESNFYSYLDVYMRIKNDLKAIDNKNFIQEICNCMEANTNLKEKYY